MRILKGKNVTVLKHQFGPVHLLFKLGKGAMGIQRYKEAGQTTRLDIVFVADTKEKARIVRRGIVGGYLSKPSIFWIDRTDRRIISTQPLKAAKRMFRANRIPLEILEVAVSNFETDFKRRVPPELW